MERIIRMLKKANGIQSEQSKKKRKVIVYCNETQNTLSDSLSDTSLCIRNDKHFEWRKKYFGNYGSPTIFSDSLEIDER